MDEGNNYGDENIYNNENYKKVGIFIVVIALIVGAVYYFKNRPEPEPEMPVEDYVEPIVPEVKHYKPQEIKNKLLGSWKIDYRNQNDEGKYYIYNIEVLFNLDNSCKVSGVISTGIMDSDENETTLTQDYLCNYTIEDPEKIKFTYEVGKTSEVFQNDNLYDIKFENEKAKIGNIPLIQTYSSYVEENTTTLENITFEDNSSTEEKTTNNNSNTAIKAN